MNSKPILELKGVSKSFPGVRALKSVDFNLYSHEILGLSGENGAGKSTLIKILGGVHHPDEGSIEFFGEQVKIHNTREGIAHGISIIYQELSLVPELSVAENIYLGALPRHAGRIDHKTLYAESEEILKTLGLDLDPRQKVSELSISKQQLVEIGKAIARDTKIIVMDEPTSSLGREDAERLFEVMRSLREKGCGIIFITHRLNEFFAVSDRITVLRDGELIETRNTSDWDMDSLVFAMVNRKIDQLYPKREIPIGDEVLSVSELDNPHVHNINFTVNCGEIVGLAGLVGSGRSELLKTLFGAYPLKSGSISIGGRVCEIKSPKAALRYGLALVPEDRKGEGLLLESSVKENVVLSVLDRIAKFFIVPGKRIDELGEDSVRVFDIKTPSKDSKVLNLSGGNQQKIVFARNSETEPKILLLDEPTRGIDIGTKVEIYKRIMDFAEGGAAIILVSSDLTEIMGLTDRVFVMREGSMTAQVKTSETDSKEIMDYATGGK